MRCDRFSRYNCALLESDAEGAPPLKRTIRVDSVLTATGSGSLLMQAEADLYTPQHPRRVGSSAMAYPLGAARDSRRLVESPDAVASRSFHVSGGLPRFSIFRKTA
jgi:hypothetical protein